MDYGRERVRKQYNSRNTATGKFASRVVMDGLKILFLLMVLAAVVGGAFLVGTVRGIIKTAPPADTLTVTPLGIASVIYDANGLEKETLVASGSNRDPVSYDRIPQDLIDAFVAIEDARFWTHEGVDIRGIMRSGYLLVMNGGISGGASTITQQLIKNNIFEGGMERGWGARFVRKFQEQYLALLLERNTDKKNILINYLNTINLGANCLGVQVASQRYFLKDVSELTLSECACLAGITQNPYYYNPIRFPEHNEVKREIVLDYMEEQGYITPAEKKIALADTESLYERIHDNNLRIQASATPYSYFTDAVITQVLQDLQLELGYSEADAYTLLYSGGLNIYTTQVSTIQDILDEEINNPDNYPADAFKWSFTYRLNAQLKDGTTVTYTDYSIRNTLNLSNLVYGSKEEIENLVVRFKEAVLEEGDTVADEQIYYTLQPQLAATVIDQQTGRVLAMTGGRGEKVVSRSLNRVTDTLRSPGSTFKVLGAFAPALDVGRQTLASVTEDVPYQYDGTPIRNWWDSSLYLGWCNARSAIVYSMNVVSVKFMMEKARLDRAFDYLESFGFSTLVRSETIGNRVYTDMVPTLCLGGLTKGVNVLELTDAYATIANGGTYREPVLYTHITDHDGNLLFVKEQNTHRVIKESTAFLLTDAMAESTYNETIKNSGISPTAIQASLSNMAAAGKSGTSTDASGKARDLWFVGYTPYYTLGVWSGFDDGSVPLQGNVEMNGYHFTVWNRVMTRIHSGYRYTPFAAPDDVSYVRVCSLSGKLAVPGVCDQDPNCRPYYEYFAEGTEPLEYCSTHQLVTICTDTGLPAGPYCVHTEKKIYYMLNQHGITPTLDTPYFYPFEDGTYCRIRHTPDDPDPQTASGGATDQIRW